MDVSDLRERLRDPMAAAMTMNAALIGFGEAGSTFAKAGGWTAPLRVHDRLLSRNDAADALGLATFPSGAEAVAGAGVVLSLVTADAALAAAEAAAPALAPGALWCDMNSIAPGTKMEVAHCIEAAGGRYVDVAVMAPVQPACMAVPLLLSGAAALAAEAALGALGFANTRVVGMEVGRASTIKMLRSVMYKGMEALTAECLIACERAGVTDEVLGSFGNDWASGADYRFDRMLVHGRRRAAELREVCRTLEDLGLPPAMSSGTVAWQQRLGDLDLGTVPQGLAAKLERILGALASPVEGKERP